MAAGWIRRRSSRATGSRWASRNSHTSSTEAHGPVDEPLAVALKFGFLAVLYLFLLWVARSAMKDLSRYEGAAVADAREPARPGRASPGPEARPGAQPRLEGVASLCPDAGTAFNVSGGAEVGSAGSSAIPAGARLGSSCQARRF